MRPFISSPRAPVTAARMNIMGQGNSLMFGAGSSGQSMRWLSQAAAMEPILSSGITIRNAGVNGQTIQQMRASAPAAIDAYLDPTKINVVVFQEFTNELTGNGGFSTSAHNQLKGWCQDRRTAAATAGATLRLMICTAVPFGNASTGTANTMNAAAIAVNGLIRSQFRDYADVIVDLAAEQPFAAMVAANVWAPSAFQAQSVYTRSDTGLNDLVHFGDSGYAVFANAFIQALKRVRR